MGRGSGSAGAGFIATNISEPEVADIGIYDAETDGGVTYEFIVNVPEVVGASSAFMGSLNAPEGQSAGLKFDQWQNSGTYGATAFGVADYTSEVAHTVGEDTHVVFVADGDVLDIFVNGEYQDTLSDASVTLSGLTGIGHAYNHDNEGSVDPLGGTLIGVAVYDEALGDGVISDNYEAFLASLRLTVENLEGENGASARLTWNQPPTDTLPNGDPVTYELTVTDADGNQIASIDDACDAVDADTCTRELTDLPFDSELTYELLYRNDSGSGVPVVVVSRTVAMPAEPLEPESNVAKWEAAAISLGAGFLATGIAEPDVADIGAYDIETGGGITYEFVYIVPEVTGASSAFLGSLNAPEGQNAGLKFDQWPNSGTYGATAFGVADFTSEVAHAVGEETHVVFVADGFDLDIFVNGEFQDTLLEASVALSGLTGIGHAYNHDTEGSVDALGGTLLGIAIYDEALDDATIAANYEELSTPLEPVRLPGDADEDGTVAFSDFLVLAANFGAVDAAWADGDFDGDGMVNFADFLTLSSNFGRSR